MLRYRRRAVALGLLLVLAASLWLSRPPAPATAWPAAKIGYGMIDNTMNADRIAGLGFNWAKYLVSWRETQPDPNSPPNYGRYDALVNTARSKGLHVLLRVDDPPAWAATDPNHRNSPPRNVDEFGAFLAGLAAHFKDRVEAYEIWNEPNLAHEWGEQPPSPEYFALMLRAAYVGIKQADPDAIVVAGGLSTTGGEWEDPNPPPDHIGDLGYLSRLARAMLANGWDTIFDAIGSHPYGGPYPPEQDYRLDNSTTPVGLYFRRAELQREAWRRVTGQEKPVWITEFGWLTDFGWNCPPWDSSPTGRTAQKVTPQQQADYLVRAFQYAHVHWPWVGPLFVFNLDKAVGQPDHNCNAVPDYYFSLLKPDGSPTEAYLALKAMPKPDVDYVPTPTPTPTNTPTPTPTWAPVTGTFFRGIAGVLTSNNESVRLEVPADALPSPILGATIRFAPAATPMPTPVTIATPTAVPVMPIFELTALDVPNGQPVTDLATPITMTIRYDERRGAIESGIRLYRRPTDTDDWTTAGILTQSLDTANNVLVARVITLSQFTLLAPPSQRVTLPRVVRQATGSW